MKVMIIGAGCQGGPCALISAKQDFVTDVKLCDIDAELLEKVKARVNSSKLTTAVVDARDVDSIAAAAEGMDAIIDLTTPDFFINIMKAAIKSNCHYVNTAWEEYLFEGFEDLDSKTGHITLDSKLKMTDEFKAKGLTAVLGCGATCGFNTNVLIRLYVDKMDTVESIKIREGMRDLNIPKGFEHLVPYNPGWSVKTALLDYARDTWKFQDGEFIRMTGPFQEAEIYDFPEPTGPLCLSHHGHEEPYSLPFTFKDKGLKYCDFKYYIPEQVGPLVAVGLASEKKINVKGVEIAPVDILTELIPAPADRFVGETRALAEWLDANPDKNPMNTWRIVNEIKGTENGKNVTYKVGPMIPAWTDLFDAYGTILTTIALPALIGAKLAYEGTTKGVITSDVLDPNEFMKAICDTGIDYSKLIYEEKIVE